MRGVSLLKARYNEAGKDQNEGDAVCEVRRHPEEPCRRSVRNHIAPPEVGYVERHETGNFAGPESGQRHGVSTDQAGKYHRAEIDFPPG